MTCMYNMCNLTPLTSVQAKTKSHSKYCGGKRKTDKLKKKTKLYIIEVKVHKKQ